MNIELIAHNFFFLLGGVINIILAIFVLYMSRRRINMSVITFIGMTISIAIFQISHVMGVLAPTAEISQAIFMFNLVNIPIGIFIAHWFLSLISVDKTVRGKVALVIMYVTGIILLAVYTIYPNTFLLESVPKLYFPFYYNPGNLHTWMRAWFNVIGLYAFIELIIAYRTSIDPIQKNRYKYAFASILFGFILGSTAILLVYDIPFDPFWSSFFGLYTIPLAYAMVKYELLDIRVLAKRAILYTAAIICAGIMISVINLLDKYMVSNYPGFPGWISQVVVSIIVGFGGIFIWRKAREADLLKYKFLTIVTHKFRTPLTKIRWSLSEIRDVITKNPALALEIKDAVATIERSDNELVELTNVLTTLNDKDAADHLYQSKEMSLSEIVASRVESYRQAFASKKILLSSVTSPNDDTLIFADPAKILFMIDILVDNALIYTPEQGNVEINVSHQNNRVLFTVKDSGIGIPKSVRNFLFTKFYRTPNARIESTEGTGIGLFMAKLIIERSGGTISADSEGEGKGTTVTVSFETIKRPQ